MIADYEAEKEIRFLPKEGVIATFPLFRLKPPGFLRQPRVKEAHWTGAELSMLTNPPRNEELWKGHRALTFAVEQEFDVDSHARLLAKIAHVTAVGHLGLNAFEHWLPPYILRDDPCLSYLVGGFDAPEEPVQVLHEMKYEVWPQNGEFLVTMNIRLFARFGGPHSKVVIGRSTEQMLRTRAPFLIHEKGSSIT